MLRPSYLENLPAPVVSLADELQNEIIDDLVKRIVKGKYNTPSSEWMLYKANTLRKSSAEINKIIAKNAKVREQLVKEIYTDAVKEALSSDAEIYRYAMRNPSAVTLNLQKMQTYFRDIALSNTFKTGLAATNGLMNNLTKSMAATANRMLSDALDLAWLEVASGAFTPDEACFKAVEKLSANGLKVVNYSSGHNDQVDVAVRRAVRTGINKTCCDMQLELAEDVGCDLVEVTSHFGARPSHAEWQGQIYSLSGKNPKYKDFRSATGFGTGDGLGGWNCRHSFFPYFEGLSLPANSPTFTAEENLEMYENQQQQRAYERAVRRSKRDLAGLDAARQSTSDPQLKQKLDKEFAKKSVTLKKREERLSQFCKDKGLMPDSARVRVVGFGRSEAQKAVWAAKKSSQNGLTSGGGSGTISKGKSSGNSGSSSSGGLPQNVGTVDFSDKSKVFEQLSKYQMMWTDKDHEFDCTVTPDGKIWITEGTSSQVHPEMIEKVSGGSSLKGSYSYHNHPRNETEFSLSSDDVGFFFEHECQYSKASDYKYEYYMERTTETAHLSYAEAAHKFKVLSTYDAPEYAATNNLNIDVDNYHITMMLLSKEYGFKYERKEIQP